MEEKIVPWDENLVIQSKKVTQEKNLRVFLVIIAKSTLLFVWLVTSLLSFVWMTLIALCPLCRRGDKFTPGKME
jgi:hypothetical protein